MSISQDPQATLLLPSRGELSADRGMQHPEVHDLTSHSWKEVPWRAIIATVGVVCVTVLGFVALYVASRVVVLTVIAGFFAVVMARPVRALQTKFGIPRAASIAVVVAGSLSAFAGLVTLFILPVRSQLAAAITDLPGTVSDAADGRGPIGKLVTKLNVEQLVRDNQASLTKAASSMQKALPSMLGSALEIALSALTVVVMVFLMLSQADAMGRTCIRALPARHREMVRTVAREAARAVSGYMIGNLLISLCAGLAAFAILSVLGVANAVVLALWVAFADLIPLVGATLGAVVAVLGAFLVSPTAGVIALVFFVLYQQFENSVLQIMIMSRTVQVNPLVVLLSVIVGVELFGFVGALLSVPFAGAFAVVLKEAWRHRPAHPDDLILLSDERGMNEPPEHTKTKRWRRRER